MGMEYLDENGLARYDGLIKQWVTFKSGTVDGVDPLLNWQKTTTASTVSFYPLPAAPLDPVVTFAFTETGPAEGTKGPDNPSTITGVSSITVTRCEAVGVDSTDYVVDLNGTFYGGSVDLSAGTITVTHRGFELNPDTTTIACSTNYEGTNTSACYFTPSPLRVLKKACAWSNRFVTDETIGSLTRDTEMIFTSASGTSILLRINKTLLGSGYDATSATAIKAAWVAWLKANSTYIVYELAAPQTLQLTPTQIYSLSQSDPYTPRLNTVYSNQQSVQVGYPKSPQATATELTNAIISLGGNV